MGLKDIEGDGGGGGIANHLGQPVDNFYEVDIYVGAKGKDLYTRTKRHESKFK